ncbi:MAG: N-6 DNA methylase [Nanoarchaeota archaeon]|nr:N-6 DNA methylase [Nanoarchaeota archaeon]
MKKEKKFLLGQYFTKTEVINSLISLMQKYSPINKNSHILEPSAGTRNFVKVLNNLGFNDIEECEIDPELTKKPYDFFSFDLSNKFDFIIGNPPFTKYNLKDSYYYPKKYADGMVKPFEYLTSSLLKKEKMQIENAFILKSIKHLKNKESSLAFVLPISFFIGKKNQEVKGELLKRFSTIIIYQNDKNWFDEPIPCCFAIFTNNASLKGKAVLLYEDGINVEEYVDINDLLTEELIPKSFLYKKENKQNGTPLSDLLENHSVEYNKSYTNNNISGKNILSRGKIPNSEKVEDYCLAVTRVGNSSVGKSGFVNPKKDILNDMFFLFEFKSEYRNDKDLKEKICAMINENQQHFKSSTIRVGSKSIKKSDVFNFKVAI